MYLTSPSEIQRIALTKEKQKRYVESLGSCFTVIQSPEPPQKGFFQSFFSSTPSPLNREELCKYNHNILFVGVTTSVDDYARDGGPEEV